MRRRWAVRVGVALVAGLMLNVLVAWSIGVLVSPSWLTSQYGIAGDGWPIRAPDDWPDADYWFSQSAFGYNGRSASANMDELARTRRQDPSVVVQHATAHEYGLPFRSLACRRLIIQRGRQIRELAESPLRRGFEASLFGYDVPYRRIAFRPLWVGFVLNSLFYGLLAIAMVWTIRELRRRRRVRRGLCPKCAYDLTGLVDCPECGTASPKAIQEAE